VGEDYANRLPITPQVRYACISGVVTIVYSRLGACFFGGGAGGALVLVRLLSRFHPDRGGAKVLKVDGTISRSDRAKKNLDPHLLHTCETRNNTAQFSLL